MTQTETATIEDTPDWDTTNQPSHMPLQIVVARLAPAFLEVTGGDFQLAQRAVLEIINDYRANNNVDLMVIGQIIGASLSAMGSYGSSLEPNQSVSKTLRLRASGNACSRAAEQNRRVLRGASARAKAAPAEQWVPSPSDEEFDPAEVIANVKAVQARLAEAKAQKSAEARAAAPPAPQPEPPAPAPIPAIAPAAPILAAALPAPPPAETQAAPPRREFTDTQKQWHSTLASAAVKAASKYAADLPNMTPDERRMATIRMKALTDSANDILAGNIPEHFMSADAPDVRRFDTG